MREFHHTHRNGRFQNIAWTYNHTDIMLRKLPACPLLLCIILSFMLALSSSSPRNATRRPGKPHPRLSNHSEDYNDYYEENTEVTRKPVGPPPPFCHYDICKDQQESCQKLALTHFCLCPGISGPFELPDPPVLQSLSLESRGRAVVRWCAPPSVVTHYLVQVGGRDEALKTTENRRMMELGDIAAGTEVCVQAVNLVGVSARKNHSCVLFDPSSSETSLAVKLVLIGAAVLVMVVVIALVLLLWWCLRHRKTRTANRGTDVVL